MNIKSIAAFAVAMSTFTLISCQWFASSKKEQSTSSLIGRWHLDSLQPGNDSNMVYAFIAMAMNDSLGVDVEFRKDTMITYSGNSIDTALYQYDAGKQQLQVKDSTEETMAVSFLNDSLLSLTAKDKAILFFKKR